MTRPGKFLGWAETSTIEGVLGWFYPVLLAWASVGILQDSRWAQGKGLTSHPVIGFLGFAVLYFGYWAWNLWALRRRRTRLDGDSPAQFERWRQRLQARSVIIGVPLGLVLAAAILVLDMPFSMVLSGVLFLLALVSLARGEHMHRIESLDLEARRQALQARLTPHFLFNTLNTLHAQIEQDPGAAQATTEKLAQLFRQVITFADQPTVPLKQELEFVEAYLSIEQSRLGDRLQVSVQVPEELESARIPPLSLQVLAENAVKHGVGPLERGGEIRIGAEGRGRDLHVWVEDPGSGFSAHRGTGTALDTLRQRLDRPQDLESSMVNGRHRVGFTWRRA